MVLPLVECVPNFSEGRDQAKIKAITDAIEAAGGVRLLNVEPGFDTNRTVVTFVGSPEAVENAAFAGIARAAQLIDMSKHTGAHPRMGATDVCPFVPVEGVTMADCATIARRLGERVGRDLGIPVYLYEAAATRPERRSLSDVRKGEYEGLAKKLADAAWAPDFGPATLNVGAGATVIGAREFLVAYNVNLNSTDKNHAADLAFALREKGRVARSGNTAPYYVRGKKLSYREGAFPCGSCALVAATYEEVRAHCEAEHGYDLDALLRSNDLNPPFVVGKNVYRPGLFKACKAMFGCGTPFENHAGMDGILESNFAESKKLLKEAGYDGTPIVLLQSTDLAVLTNLAPVAKSLMEKAKAVTLASSSRPNTSNCTGT